MCGSGTTRYQDGNDSVNWQLCRSIVLRLREEWQALRGGIVPAALSHKGDIIIWYDDPGEGEHIGFCAVNGCGQTYSNSTSMRTFAPVTHSISFDGYFKGYFIWEPDRIPSAGGSV
jgi:hypothetical protein